MPAEKPASEELSPVCAATFEDYLEAEHYRNRLRAEGIPAELVGPNPSSGFGLSMGMLSQVSVLVPARFASRLNRLSADDACIALRGTGACHSAQPRTPIRLRKIK
jgi:hypothetical protein